MNLTGLGRLVAKPFDEPLDPFNLLGLSSRGRFQRSQAFLPCDHELGEASDVFKSRPPGDFHYPLSHGINEVAIVRNEQNGTRPVTKLIFQPRHRINIEMVGRLVQQKTIGILQ